MTLVHRVTTLEPAGGSSEAAEDELAKLVDERPIAVRAQHVDEGLRRDDLRNRRCERRRSCLVAYAFDLVQDLVQPITGGAAS